MRSWQLEAGIAAAMVSWSVAAASIGGQVGDMFAGPPMVAVVSTSGQLRPLAVHVAGDWTHLNWPSLSPPDGEPSPVPQTVAAIPREWFAPAASLPRSWQMQSVDGSIREVTLRVPARWDAAMELSVGIRVDDAPSDRFEDTDAGIAVAGGVTALPTRHLDASSAEWQAIVRAHNAAFAAAERAAGRSKRAFSAAALRRQLLAGEINLWKAEITGDLTYFYFHTFLLRSPECANLAVEHFGLIEHQRKSGLRLKWIRARSLSCQDHSDGTEIVGAVRVGEQIRLVVKGGEGEGVGYGFADPRASESEFRRQN